MIGCLDSKSCGGFVSGTVDENGYGDPPVIECGGKPVDAEYGGGGMDDVVVWKNPHESSLS